MSSQFSNSWSLACRYSILVAVSSLSLAELELESRVFTSRLSNGVGGESKRMYIVLSITHSLIDNHVQLYGSCARAHHVEFRHRLAAIQSIFHVLGISV